MSARAERPAATGGPARPVLYGDLRRWALISADCLRMLKVLPDDSVDAVVTDPPYGLAFGGEAWDGGELADPEGFEAFCWEWAEQAWRVLKPGGHLVSFGSPRTFHRLVVGAEDAGLEIRDTLIWLHGAGVPKSRRIEGGLGTSLKPAFEPILLARAPLPAGHSVKATIDAYGTGALNIDAARLPRRDHPTGYWPSHVLLAHARNCSPEPEGAGACAPGCPVGSVDELTPNAGSEGLSRLFYAAKASREEREAGCEQLSVERTGIFSRPGGLARARANIHPTVKPLDLMRWLIRLSVPPGGVALDPFAGSATTGCAAVLEGRQFIGIECEHRYLDIARARLAHWSHVAERSRSEAKAAW